MTNNGCIGRNFFVFITLEGGAGVANKHEKRTISKFLLCTAIHFRLQLDENYS